MITYRMCCLVKCVKLHVNLKKKLLTEIQNGNSLFSLMVIFKEGQVSKGDNGEEPVSLLLIRSIRFGGYDIFCMSETITYV